MIMTWWPVKSAQQVDEELRRISVNEDYDFNRLLGATTNDLSSHGGNTDALLMLTILSVMKKAEVKEMTYFVDVGAGLGQPCFLIHELARIGFIKDCRKIIAIERDTERSRFLRNRISKVEKTHNFELIVDDIMNIKNNNSEKELHTHFSGGKGIIYCNNLIWDQQYIHALENLIVDWVLEGTCIISTARMFMYRDGLGGRTVHEKKETFEIANVEFSWQGNSKGVVVYYYRIV